MESVVTTETIVNRSVSVTFTEEEAKALSSLVGVIGGRQLKGQECIREGSITVMERLVLTGDEGGGEGLLYLLYTALLECGED